MISKRMSKRKLIYIILGALATLIIVVTLSIRQILAPPSTAPDFSGPKPEIADDGYITNSEKVIIDLPLDQYLEWVETQLLEDALTGRNNVPSVVRTEIIQGSWNEVGARRMIELSDGHYVVEEVLAKEDPRLFRYQVWGFTNFARFAVDYAIGEFLHEEIDGKTQITWTYSFHNRSALTSSFLENFVESTWAPYMQQYLHTSKENSEKAMKDG